MKHVRPLLAVVPALALAGALAACGDDATDPPATPDAGDEAPPDAGLPAGNLACAGEDWPTTAPDPLAMQGYVRDVINDQTIGAATVTVHDATDDAVLATDVSSFDGEYVVDVETGGTAPLTYRKVTKDGRADGYTYDPFPMSDPLVRGNAISLAPDDLAAVAPAGGVTHDPAAGLVLVDVLDCERRPIAGATIEVPGAARVLYIGADFATDPALTQTTSAGSAYVINVPAGEFTATVRAGSLTFRDWPARAHAGAFTLAPRLP